MSRHSDFQTDYLTPVAGVDEAGRGPWAGPVVAAAVVFTSGRIPDGLNDSKKLTKAKREYLYPLIMLHHVGVGVATVEEIDALNIRRANHLAMQRAIGNLPIAPATILVDGNDPVAFKDYPATTIAIIGGDGFISQISAASIVAKVTRDAIMAALDVEFPGYGWLRNQGYGTAAHADALARLGVTQHHRRSFAPIRARLAQS
jgi:ribonuclease HII